jgi:hypothetical protein
VVVGAPTEQVTLDKANGLGLRAAEKSALIPGIGSRRARSLC